MKKLLAFVFVFATVVVATNVLSSCKDYDGDTYDDLQLQLARNDKSLRDLIGNNYEELCSLYNEVKTAQEQCSINCVRKHAQLDIAIDSLKGAVKGKADTATVNAIKREIVVINQDITTLTTNYIKLDSTVNVIQNSIINIYSHISRLAGQVTADSANIQDLLGRVGTNEGNINDLLNRVGINEGKINDLLNRVGINEGNIADLLTTVGDIQGDITTIKSDIATINNRFDNYYTKVEVDSLDSILNAKIDTLESHVNDRFITLESKVNEVASKAQDAWNRAVQDSVWIAELKKNLEKTNERIDSLAGVTQHLEDSLDSYVLKDVYNQFVTETNNKIAALEAADERLESLIDSIDSLRKNADDLLQRQINAIVLAMQGQSADISGLRDSVANILDVRIPNVETAFQNADQLLQGQIDDINDEISDIKDRLDDVEDAIDKLTDRVSDLEKKINQITAIIPQATVNPVFGTFAAPVGISSKVLMAFYGEITSPVEFPTNATANYVKYSDKFTASDWSMISSIVSQETYTAGTIVSGEKDGKASAGTLYVTVNPSEEDFEGQTLKLVNSKDEESKVTLTPLKAENDYEIMFGYTRAASANGLYKAEAKLDKADIDAVKISLNKSELQDAGYEQAENFLNDVIDEIKDQLKTQAAKYIDKAKDKIADMTPELKKLAILNINKITGEVAYDVVFAPTMTDADGNTYIVRIDVVDATPKIYDAATGKMLYSLGDEGFVVKSDGVHVTVTDKVLYNYLADGIMSVNQLVGSLEDFIEDVNDLVASVSTKADPLIDKAGNKIYSKLHSYLDKINRKLVNFVNTTGARIQPTLLVVSGGGTKLASGVSGMPTKVDAASVNLIPTTYTAEIVAPAYKKHIIAVDVIKGGASAQGGDTDCKNALNAFNGQVNKVIDGTSMESIPVTLESGYTYVVAYSALDYHGKISMQKFYIKY